LLKTGVYKIVNKVNNKIYIGSSAVNITKRFYEHLNSLRHNYHYNFKLQNDFNKYGESNFNFEVLELIEPVKCVTLEQFYINTLQPYYNISPIAQSQLGFKHSVETKQRISQIKKGTIVTLKTRHKISNTMKNIMNCDSNKRKIALVNLERCHPKKAILCVELNKIFESVHAAAKFIRANYNKKAAEPPISCCARGFKRYSHAYNFTWKYI
jgi:group I intron endonuclease